MYSRELDLEEQQQSQRLERVRLVQDRMREQRRRSSAALATPAASAAGRGGFMRFKHAAHAVRAANRMGAVASDARRRHDARRDNSAMLLGANAAAISAAIGGATQEAPVDAITPREQRDLEELQDQAEGVLGSAEGPAESVVQGQDQGRPRGESWG